MDVEVMVVVVKILGLRELVRALVVMGCVLWSAGRKWEVDG